MRYTYICMVGYTHERGPNWTRVGCDRCMHARTLPTTKAMMQMRRSCTKEKPLALPSFPASADPSRPPTLPPFSAWWGGHVGGCGGGG